MFDTTKALKVTALSMEFKKAVENHMMTDSVVFNSLSIFVTAEDEQKTDALNDRFDVVLAQAQSEGRITEEFLKVSLEMVDTVTEVAQRVMDDDAIAAFVPEGLCDKAVMDMLKKYKAEHVLKICDHKLSMG